MFTKIAVVSGTSYGLGKGIAEILLQNKYKVYGVSRTKSSFSNADFVWIKADLTKDRDIHTVSTVIEEEKIDLLVNSVGRVVVQSTQAYSDARFDQTFDLNFKAPIKVAVQLLSKLSGGMIVNISSDSDRSPDPDFGLYGSSKAALNLFFETMASENPNIKIINLLPSYIDTPLLHKIYDDTNFDWSLCMSINDVAQALGYILDHASQFETGSRILILKKFFDDGIYNPEKLWVYATDNQSVIKVS